MNQTLHFLVVDDFATMRHIIINLLKEIGYGKISEADDGDKALRLLQAKQDDPMPIDFVITDWNMPSMTGLELLSAIRQDPRLSHLPVMLITAEAKKENIISAAQAGADGYIIKPFTAVTLKEKLDKIIHNKGLADE